jgi:hypothetical protein
MNWGMMADEGRQGALQLKLGISATTKAGGVAWVSYFCLTIQMVNTSVGLPAPL